LTLRFEPRPDSLLCRPSRRSLLSLLRPHSKPREKIASKTSPRFFSWDYRLGIFPEARLIPSQLLSRQASGLAPRPDWEPGRCWADQASISPAPGPDWLPAAPHPRISSGNRL